MSEHQYLNHVAYRPLAIMQCAGLRLKCVVATVMYAGDHLLQVDGNAVMVRRKRMCCVASMKL